MQDVETSLLLKYGPFILTALIGIVQYSLRSLLKNIKDDIEDLRDDVDKLYGQDRDINHKLDTLIGEHNQLCARKRR
jgi:hypothetical protein